MGRAIDNERDIDMLKKQVKKLEDIVRGMTHDIDAMSDKATKTTHIDLVDDVKKEETKDEKKEADNEGSDGSSRKSNTKTRTSSSKKPKQRANNK